MRIALHGVGLVLAVGFTLHSCSIGCDDVWCCRSCGDEQPRRACSCGSDEQRAEFCPKRSACALALYVGDGPATCCSGSCNAAEVYTSESGTCSQDDRYLHECTPESQCFQIYLADQLGTTYRPWRAEASGSGTPLRGVWAQAADNVWAVGMNGIILHRDAGGWSTFESPTSENLQSVWGSSADDIWAVGWNGTLLRFDGKVWKTVSLETDDAHLLTRVWGRAADDVWAVGTEGAILHFDGQQWRADDTDAVSESDHLTGIGAASDGSLWAIGYDGLVLENDGSAWKRRQTPTSAILAGIWPLGDELWIVGQSGTLLQRDGELGWVEREHAVDVGLVGLWGDDRRLWAVGASGAILRYDGSGWRRISYFINGRPVNLFDVSGAGGWVWAVGDKGTILAYKIQDMDQ